MYLFHWYTNRNCLSASLTFVKQERDKKRELRKKPAQHKTLSTKKKLERIVATKKDKNRFSRKKRIVNAEQQEEISHYRTLAVALMEMYFSLFSFYHSVYIWHWACSNGFVPSKISASI